MRKVRFWLSSLCLVCLPVYGDARAAVTAGDVPPWEATCRALVNLPHLTIASAELRPVSGSTLQYCYVKGMISPAIRFHVQLPLPENWNGRFLHFGDGGKDGDLDFADDRLAQGYAVANTNTGHDNGSEPGASFAFNNHQAEIDFAYRAVHLTANAAKTAIKAYYGREARYSYFEGCSTGGRQGLMEAQRFPYDFDGIVAGAPVNFYQAMNTNHVWMLQRVSRNNFAGNLAFDTDGDAVPDGLTKANILKDAVLARCDAKDGIVDGVIDDPLSCDFRPEAHLADKMCAGDVNADGCFTKLQVQTVKDIYAGAHDSRGVRIYKGKALGSEMGWQSDLIPHAGNELFPARLGTAGDHINYLFYERDPGIAPPNLTDIRRSPDSKATPPEYAWWEFNVDDFTAGKADFMMALTDAKDPDLTRFLKKKGGKLILYHGWADPASHPEPTLDYYKDMVGTTFGGDIDAARKHSRLFMVAGMDHCSGGAGPNQWDRLAPLADWVERGIAPDYIVATHSTNHRVDNERKVCAYPQRTVYTGPAGGENDRLNWLEKNFACR